MSGPKTAAAFRTHKLLFVFYSEEKVTPWPRNICMLLLTGLLGCYMGCIVNW